MQTASKNNRKQAPLPEPGRIGRFLFVWIAAAVLIVLCLIPFYAYIWRASTESRTRSKCETVAHALFEQGSNNWKNNFDWMRVEREAYCAVNAIAAWAGIYGGTNEEEIARIFTDTAMPLPDGIALLKNQEDYQVLTGDFPRDEFDYVAALANEQEEEWGCSYNEDGELIEDGGRLNEYSGLTIVDNTWYYSTYLPLSDTFAIGKKSEDAIQIPDELLVLDESIDTADADILMVLAGGYEVLRVKGDLDISVGDTIPEENRKEGWLKIGDDWYIAGSAGNDYFQIYAVVPSSEVSSRNIFSPLIPALLFAMLFLLTMLYAWFLRYDIMRGRVEKDGNKNTPQELFELMKRHMRRMFIMIALIAVSAFLLFSALYVVDDARIWGSSILDEIEGFFEDDDITAIVMTDAMRKNECDLADLICEIVPGVPGRCSSAALQDLGDGIGKSLFMLDRKGTVEAASSSEYDFSGLFDENSEWAPLRAVLEGKADHVFTIVGEGNTASVCLGVRRQGSLGMLVYLDYVTIPVSIEGYYSNYKVPDGLLLVTVDAQSGMILSSSQDAYSGMDASAIGLKDETLRNGFAGDVLINGTNYFVQTRSGEERVSLIAADLTYLTKKYLPVILLTVAAGLVLVILLFWAVGTLQKKTWRNLMVQEPHAQTSDFGREEKKKNRRIEQQTKALREKEKENTEEKEQEEKEQEEQEETASFYRESDGNLRSDRSAVGRWLTLRTPFHSMSADEKFRFVLHILVILAFACAYFLYQGKEKNGIKGSAFAFLLQHTWQNGFNIYAICYAILVIILIFAVTILIRRLVLLISKNFGSRGETIARLIGSFIGYLSVIGAIGYSLMYLGVNTMTILASAGIVGLGISIGAKDLIADILAGVSIVFEGEFRTGDIVEIGGFRGQVEEIGIRTTKVMALGNVKVFRNSEVSGVINLTQRYSIASVKVSVSRAEPLEKVEEIFKRELPAIREKIPQAVEDISMSGLVEVNTANVILAFSTKCRESDRYGIELRLKRELDLLMERENIGSWGLWKKPEGYMPPPL